MIVPFSALPQLREEHRDKAIVLASGVFDLLHRGHVAYLDRLRRFGDITVVMIKPDARVSIGKGPLRPVLPEAHRASVVDGLKSVDYTFIAPHIDFAGSQVDPMYKAAFAALQPDVFYSTNPTWQTLDKLGATKVIIAERPDTVTEPLSSTTAIIEHIRKRFS